MHRSATATDTMLVYCFSKEKTSKLVTGANTLELGISLDSLPATGIKLTNVTIQCFCQDRACGDCPIGSIYFLVLAMSFVEDAGKNSIKFLQRRQIHITNYNVKEEVKMFQALHSCIYKVGCCD